MKGAYGVPADPRVSDLAALVARARPLVERLNAAHTAAEPVDAEAQAEVWLAHWRRVVAKDDPVAFERRLNWDGLDEARVRAVLTSSLAPDGGPLPAWTATFTGALAAAPDALAFLDSPPGRSVPDQLVRLDKPLPFDDALLPWVLHARRALRDRAGDAHDGLTAAAHADLERTLLQRLAALCAPSLYEGFAAERDGGQSGLWRLIARLQSASSRERYLAFVRDFLAGGMDGFFGAYPVLARLLAVVTGLWVDAAAEFLDRLTRDRAAIGQTFARGADPGLVTAIDSTNSDAHAGGRAPAPSL